MRRAMRSSGATRLTTALVAVGLCVTAQAKERRFGSWTVGAMAGDEGVYAATVNDSGGVLGQYCLRDDAQCFWLVATDIRCEEGAKYPVLVNASSGASSTEIVCVEVDGRPRYAFTEFDVINAVVLESEWIGIAFPMAKGRFQVSRLPLRGARDAIVFMLKAGDAMVEQASKSTVDRSL